MRIIRADNLIVADDDRGKRIPPDDFDDFCPECGDFLGYEGRSCGCTEEGEDDLYGEYLDDYYEGEKATITSLQGPELDAEIGRLLRKMFPDSPSEVVERIFGSSHGTEVKGGTN